ncbi:GRAM domain-containing protein 2B-like isoform X2 [Parambassis ranga]|uniref:GRAM domain-containing protein 2B-like isoform X2 n=1 Tax=Parambassis ranga TaxID=210632 RepID=A0A6P7K0Y2_9TELE|nr:GRAM domain-containing protein 2B-like isoform X2 [Parambassis ranga]
MSHLKNRRFSLDSSVSVDGAGHFGIRKGGHIFGNKKSRHSHGLDDGQLQIHDLNHSFNSHMSLRKQTIAEENHERADGLINNHSSQKHDKSFHRLFPEIPEGENLTHTFTCALQKEVLYHGKLFISENHVCFFSSVLLKETKVVIPVSSVRKVKKHNSALYMLTIQTADEEKHTFVSFRKCEVCHTLLLNLCSHAQESANNSPHLSSAENEADHDMKSSYSSLEESMDHDFSHMDVDDSFAHMSSEGSTHHGSLTDEGNTEVSWIWRIREIVMQFFYIREIRGLSILFYIYVMLLVLLLCASGYIGQRITALEEQLNSLGSLTDVTSHHRENQTPVFT